MASFGIGDNFDVMNRIGEAVELERRLAEKERKAKVNQIALRLQFDDLCFQVSSHHTGGMCERDNELWKRWIEDGAWCEMMLLEAMNGNGWYGVQHDGSEFEMDFPSDDDAMRCELSADLNDAREQEFEEWLVRHAIPYDADAGEWLD